MTTPPLQFRVDDVILVLDDHAVDFFGVFLKGAYRFHVDFFGVKEKDKGDRLEVKFGNVISSKLTERVEHGYEVSVPKTREPEYRAFLAAIDANRTP